MTTIGLIIPPSSFLLDERVFPFLGILKVASVLEVAKYEVEVLDLSGVKNYLDVLRLYLNQTTASHIGVTSTTPQLPAAFQIGNLIRQEKPNIKTILGGSHGTLVHAAVKRNCERSVKALQRLSDNWDYIVTGDGEKAILSLLQNPEAGEMFLEKGARIVDGDDPKTELFLNNTEINTWPARHLIDLPSYHYQIDGINATSLISQLGCPFRCNFCAGRRSPSLRRARFRPAYDVLGEVEHLYRHYGYKGFMFYDDELNVSREMIDVMRGLIQIQERFKVEFRLRGFVKAEIFTEEQAEVMYQAGFRWILTGFESGSPRILKNIDKLATVDDNTRCVDIARKHGLKVKALMSLGHAGESLDTAEDTYQWLLKVQPDDFDVTIITVYPGSAYHDDAIKAPNGDYVFKHPITGDLLYSEDVDYTNTADYYKGDPNDGYIAHVYTDHLTSKELVTSRMGIETNTRQMLNIKWNQASQQKTYQASDLKSLSSDILRKSSDFKNPTIEAKRLTVLPVKGSVC